MDEEEFEDQENFRQEKTARIIYIILAVLITVTMVITVISAVNRRKGKAVIPDVDETSETETAAETVKKPDTASLPHVITPAPETKAPDKAPQTEQAEETAKAEETQPTVEQPASVERVYVVPVSGAVIKDYTMDLPVYSVTMEDYRVHNGMDIYAAEGDPVFAFTDGVISAIYGDPMMGQTVEIDHGEGLVSVYQNLQITLPDNIVKGASVKAGDVIGAVGETALIECAEVSHLHFSIKKDGAYEAPSDYIGSLNRTEE